MQLWHPECHPRVVYTLYQLEHEVGRGGFGCAVAARKVSLGEPPAAGFAQARTAAEQQVAMGPTCVVKLGKPTLWAFSGPDLQQLQSEALAKAEFSAHNRVRGLSNVMQSEGAGVLCFELQLGGADVAQAVQQLLRSEMADGKKKPAPLNTTPDAKDFVKAAARGQQPPFTQGVYVCYLLITWTHMSVASRTLASHTQPVLIKCVAVSAVSAVATALLLLPCVLAGGNPLQLYLVVDYLELELMEGSLMDLLKARGGCLDILKTLVVLNDVLEGMWAIQCLGMLHR